MSNCVAVMIEMLLFLLKLLRVSLLSPRVFNIFLIKFRGAPKIDLPLSMFSLAKSFLTTFITVSILLAGGTKIVVLVEAILGEEKSYPKLVQSKADFLRLSISSSLVLEVLSS